MRRPTGDVQAIHAFRSQFGPSAPQKPALFLGVTDREALGTAAYNRIHQIKTRKVKITDGGRIVLRRASEETEAEPVKCNLLTDTLGRLDLAYVKRVQTLNTPPSCPSWGSEPSECNLPSPALLLLPSEDHDDSPDVCTPTTKAFRRLPLPRMLSLSNKRGTLETSPTALSPPKVVVGVGTAPPHSQHPPQAKRRRFQGRGFPPQPPGAPL
eukprot:Sspe_Gene.46966::Locus_23654_Transcript_1_1_Confidence_1.000_Length_692::g.46966::m.46966